MLSFPINLPYCSPPYYIYYFNLYSILNNKYTLNVDKAISKSVLNCLLSKNSYITVDKCFMIIGHLLAEWPRKVIFDFSDTGNDRKFMDDG